MIKTYKWAVIAVDENEWVFLYDEDNKVILIEPQQCAATYTCAQTLVVADTLEELKQYITENGLTRLNAYDDLYF